MNQTPQLLVEDLHVRFRTPQRMVHAVRGVSFSVGREKVGIVGESGSGKSQTGRAILKLTPPNGTVTAKRLQFQELDIAGASEPAEFCGGDAYDIVPLAGGAIAGEGTQPEEFVLVIADATGHGIASALSSVRAEYGRMQSPRAPRYTGSSLAGMYTFTPLDSVGAVHAEASASSDRMRRTAPENTASSAPGSTGAGTNASSAPAS